MITKSGLFFSLRRVSANHLTYGLFIDHNFLSICLPLLVNASDRESQRLSPPGTGHACVILPSRSSTVASSASSSGDRCCFIRGTLCPTDFTLALLHFSLNQTLAFPFYGPSIFISHPVHSASPSRFQHKTRTLAGHTLLPCRSRLASRTLRPSTSGQNPLPPESLQPLDESELP